MEQQTGSKVHQGCILSPCLFNLYAECIMRNAGLEETQAGIKIAGRNINNLRYADDTTLMAESEEELKSLLRKVKPGALRYFVLCNAFPYGNHQDGTDLRWTRYERTCQRLSNVFIRRAT